MPLKAARVCGCGKIVPSNTICLCQQRRKAELDKRRPSASQRGYTNAWTKARASFLGSHPICAMCDQPATVVDHIQPHRGNQSLFWNKSNWQPLCAHHHNSAKQRQERRYV